ncbi:hypothetical protein [Companilactobacillus zhongbaensis]|uniref:hypothetical protein n=1 Tax=Companilactobacillus zhongbaensis TaxID=2486009 RepID=UPI000F799AE2|nr:hypothetical protein [Companilactobacillus zhongbaensis]
MSNSDYFKIDEVDDISSDLVMDPYMAMDLEFTFGVMDSAENFERFKKQYDLIDDRRFKNMISDSTTVEMSSLGMDHWFDDYMITFKDQFTLDNFKVNVSQVLQSPYDDATKLVGQQLMVAIVEGLPNAGHDDYLKTKSGMADQSLQKVYRVNGVGTVGFNFSDEDIAFKVAETLFKKASVKLNEMDPKMKLKPEMLYDYPSHIITYELNGNGDYQAVMPIKRLTPIKDPSEIKSWK